MWELCEGRKEKMGPSTVHSVAGSLSAPFPPSLTLLLPQAAWPGALLPMAHSTYSSTKSKFTTDTTRL